MRVLFNLHSGGGGGGGDDPHVFPEIATDRDIHVCVY